MGRSSDGSKNGWAHGALALGCSLQPVLRLVRADLLAMCIDFSAEVQDLISKGVVEVNSMYM